MLSNYKVYGLKPLLSSLFKVDAWRALEPVDVLFVGHDGHRSYRFNEKQYSPLLDSLQESYRAQGRSCLTVAEPFSQITGDQAFGHVVDFNGSFARAAIRRVIANRVLGKERLRGTRYIRDVWLKILSRTHPKQVVAIQPSQALCSACRQLGIEVSDLQHGVISDGHPWYGRSFRENYDTDGLPTAFLCWDKASARVLEAWAPRKGIAVRVVGNLWTRRFIAPDPSDALVREASADHAWLRALPPHNRILVTLGWGMREVVVEGMPHYLSLPTPLLNIIRETAGRAIWFVRPHPVQLRGAEGAELVAFLRENLGQTANVYWAEVSSTPLAVLLQSTDLHLTIGSTVTSEAAEFGIPTGLIAPNPRPADWLEHYFVVERDAGVAEFVPNTEDQIRRYIRSKLPDLRGT
jgi:hypothetical protein